MEEGERVVVIAAPGTAKGCRRRAWGVTESGEGPLMSSEIHTLGPRATAASVRRAW